jgi:hypothetical protein
MATINENRIVPSQEADLLYIYSTILAAAAAAASGTAPEKLSAAAPGEFSQTSNSATVLADEPVKKLTFGSSVTAATVYFVPAYNFEGFAKTGATITESGDVDADGHTLYKAALASGTVTYTKVGL